ncbi:MAG: GAF domain-containing protein [Alphaproteobacteria bacterium]|nr:GAF domain-containing protein [Alphaproteobacteria bacterium]
MPLFEIASGPEQQQVEARNWMSALGSGLGGLGLSSDSLSRVVCDLDDAGLVTVRDPDSGRIFTVRELPDTHTPEPTAAAVQLPTPERPRLTRSPEVALQDAAPVDAPDPLASAAFRAASRADLDALRGEASALLRAPDPAAAADLALGLLMRHVPAESGAVLLLSDDGLDFVAARGPRAATVQGRRIPPDAGIAGLCTRSGTALILREASQDPRHYARVDQASGYTTQALLAVPIRASGQTFGCVELLNPFGAVAFEEWHLSAAQIIAARLATRLGARVGFTVE